MRARRPAGYHLWTRGGPGERWRWRGSHATRTAAEAARAEACVHGTAILLPGDRDPNRDAVPAGAAAPAPLAVLWGGWHRARPGEPWRCLVRAADTPTVARRRLLALTRGSRGETIVLPSMQDPNGRSSRPPAT